MDLDFVIGRYTWELERKDRITSSVAFPTTILIFLGGLVGTMFQNRPASNFGWLDVVLPATALPAVVAIDVSLYHLSAAYRGSTYSFLPKLMDLQEHLDTVRAIDGSDDEGAVVERLNLVVRLRMMEATDANAAANDSRQAWLDRANAALMWSLVLTGLCGVAYVVTKAL